MKIKKTWYLFIVSLIITSATFSVHAESLNNVSPRIVDEGAGTYSSDIIEYKYRMYYGKLQYRRWNSTKGYWIDATWLDA